MNGMLLSLFIGLILIFRLLPMSRTTNIAINAIAGIVFLLLGISEVHEKGWKGIVIAGAGLLFIIFAFIPKLTLGTAYASITIILSLIIIISVVLSDFSSIKKSLNKNRR
jgi:hypothetical protein